MIRSVMVAAAASFLVGCGAEQPPKAKQQVETSDPAPEVNGDAREAPPPPQKEVPPAYVAETLIRAEWQKAENRNHCAPIAFTDDGGRNGAPRRANFSGGWAVAFDLPAIRSAYGIAGPGLIDADQEPAAAQRQRLAGQWPYFRDLAALPQPAFAGYGVEGAEPFPDANASGEGLPSLAYLRIEGQACTYNVWSRLGRAHLERLLDSLRLLPPPQPGDAAP